jgi:hypothetical protein
VLYDTLDMHTTQSVAASEGQLTSAPVAVPAVTASTIYPEWIRLPKSGHLCPWTGLTRSKLNELVLPCPANDGKAVVKSICLRKRGAQKGVRLIHLRSLLDYLEAQGRDQNQTEESPAT